MNTEPRYDATGNGLSDRIARVWQTYSQRSHPQLKRDLRLHGLLLGLLFVFIVFVISPYPDICYLSPAGWFRAPGSWFYFWLPLFWSLLFTVHFFIVSALTVDEERMVQKSREIRSRSTDFAHMENIMDRQWDGDESVMSPFDPRRKTDAFGKPKTKPSADSGPEKKDADSSDS